MNNINSCKLKCRKLYDLTRQFVRKYYETLHSDINILHKFYDQDAILCHLEDEDYIIEYFSGISQIKECLKLKHWKNCKIVIDRIDHQPLNGTSSSRYFLDSVLICVHGYLFQDNCLRGKRFSQNFIISKNRKKFYVIKNDILRFLPYWHPTNGKNVRVQTEISFNDLHTLEKNFAINHFGDTEYHIFNLLSDSKLNEDLLQGCTTSIIKKNDSKQELNNLNEKKVDKNKNVNDKPKTSIIQKVQCDDWMDMYSKNSKIDKKKDSFDPCLDDIRKTHEKVEKNKIKDENSSSKQLSESLVKEETVKLQKSKQNTWSKVVSAIHNERQIVSSNFGMSTNKINNKNRHLERWKRKYSDKSRTTIKKSNDEKTSREKGESRTTRKITNKKNEFYEKNGRNKKRGNRQEKKDEYKKEKTFDETKILNQQQEEKRYDIYIRTLPHDCRKDELKDMLDHYGAVSDIDVRVRKIGDPRYGFASFKDPNVGKKIIKEAQDNLVFLKDLPLQVEEHTKAIQMEHNRLKSNRGTRNHGCQKNNKKKNECRRNFLSGRHQRSSNNQKRFSDRHNQRKEEGKKQAHPSSKQHEIRKTKK